jgi:hypothetical protein
MDSGRSLLGIAVAIGAIALAAVVAVGVGSSRPPISYPEGSPEAAIQAYLRAWGDADDSAAYASFSTAVQGHISFVEYQQFARDRRGPFVDPNGPAVSVYIDTVRLDGDRATATLTVEETWSGGVFNTNVFRSRRSIGMIRESGAWKIDIGLVWLDPAPDIPK